jgi:PhnB protein
MAESGATGGGAAAETVQWAKVAPNIFSSNATEHVAWLEKALGAKRLSELYKDDKGHVMHGAVDVMGGQFYLADWASVGGASAVPGPDTSAPSKVSGAGRGVYFHVNVDGEDTKRVDEIVKTAAAAGAHVVQEPEDTHWGARFAVIRDPFGFDWGFSVSTKAHTEKKETK